MADEEAVEVDLEANSAPEITDKAAVEAVVVAEEADDRKDLEGEFSSLISVDEFWFSDSEATTMAAPEAASAHLAAAEEADLRSTGGLINCSSLLLSRITVTFISILAPFFLISRLH